MISKILDRWEPLDFEYEDEYTADLFDLLDEELDNMSRAKSFVTMATDVLNIPVSKVSQQTYVDRRAGGECLRHSERIARIP
jgi:hypothetical protein